MITWTHEMETGVSELDNQHRKLIDKFNELEIAIRENRGREATGKILEYVQFYADWHFKSEEKCMHEFRCPLAKDNKDQHDYFLKRFSNLHYQYYQTNADPEIVRQTVEELGEWIANHISHTDTSLKPCVGSARGSTSVE